MKELTNVFHYGLNEVRTVIKNNEPWFVAKDVCEVLEIKNSHDALNRLDTEEKATSVLPTQFGNKEMNLVNESGLYALIFTSRKDEAKKFKKWVTSEVLPLIRKHGTYMTPETIEKVLADPDTIIKIATDLKEERLKRQQAELKIQQDKPKVLFAEAVEVSNTSILIGELSKLLKQNGIDIGQNRLFKWMRNEGYLIKKKGDMFNLPTQYSMDLGLFEIKKRVVSNPDGSIRTTRTPKVTGKGQIYFINKFLEEQAVS